MIKHIIREVEPDCTDFAFYFDGDVFREAGWGDFCGNLFITSRDYQGNRPYYGFNQEAFDEVYEDANNIATALYYSNNYPEYKEQAQYYGADKTIHAYCKYKRWEKQHEDVDIEAIADYLTIKTGKEWAVYGVHGYCQGEYAEVLYCKDFYTEKTAEICGELWLGCGKEFCVIGLDENGEEVDKCYGYFVADCEAWHDEDYKKLVCEWACIEEEETRLEIIDGYKTQTVYSYRVA